MINDIARVLDASPAALIGYQKQELRLESLADVVFVLDELYKKAGLHFDIDVKRPPQDEEWSCSLRFDGKNAEAEYNADFCQFLEQYAHERLCLETYFTDQDYFDQWLEKQLAYFSTTTLEDRKMEKLTTEERLRRRNALDQKLLEAKRKAAEENGGE